MRDIALNLSDRIEKYTQYYGEQWRRLITDSLEWLETREPVWELEEPLDRDEFIADLIAKVYKV